MEGFQPAMEGQAAVFGVAYGKHGHSPGKAGTVIGLASRWEKLNCQLRR